jgi:hypothetical protein
MVPRIDIAPESRLEEMQQHVTPLRERPLGACGGFSAVYKAMCDYHGLAFMEEVAWVGSFVLHSLDTLVYMQFCVTFFPPTFSLFLPV